MFINSLQIKGKEGQGCDSLSDENKDESLSPTGPLEEILSDKENKSEDPFTAPPVEKKIDVNLDDLVSFNSNDKLVLDDSSEGWQEAVSKGRTPASRKSSNPRRPSLAKLNTDFVGAPLSQKHRGAGGSNFTRNKSPNEPVALPGSVIVAKKVTKSPSFSPKQVTPAIVCSGAEKSVNAVMKAAVSSTSAPSEMKPAFPPITVQATTKLFSYKEVALAPPGTIVKAVTELLPKDGLQSSKEDTAEVKADETKGNTETEDKNQTPVAEKPVTVPSEKLGDGIDDNQKKIDDISQKEVVDFAVQDIQAKCAAEPIAEGQDGKSNSSKEAISDAEPSSIDADSLLVPEISPLDLPNSDTNLSPVSADGEEQDAIENRKEAARKLSAAAPPFNPSLVPVFSTVIVAANYNDHVGILPSPGNVPPMLGVNAIRRSPHQSATARVPYGPRLSGTCNKFGSRVPQFKPGSQSNEQQYGDGHFSPPGIMNPHAAEFVPGQTWVPNGYAVFPNGYIAASHNGIPVAIAGYSVSPNGILMSPNGNYPSPKGIPVLETEFPALPVNSMEIQSSLTEDSDEKDSGLAEQDTEKPDAGEANQPTEENNDKEKTDSAEVTLITKSDDTVKQARKETATNNEASNVTDALKENSDGSLVEGTQGKKSWADYSDDETENAEDAT